VHLIADNLTLERGPRTLVEGLSFAVAGGEALVLTGPNGAGKTTLLRAIAGLFSPSAGAIRLDGGAADTGVPEQCHFIGHQNGLKSALTVTENLTFWAAYLGQSAPERVTAALERLDLAPLAAIPAGYLSAGQKRRLGLARLLVAERPVWLLDEPTVSLDAVSTGRLSAIVNAHVAGGGIAIAATHLPLGLESARELALKPGLAATRPEGQP
jgi:heme exporter protein A